jgi:hypothetical protein
VGGAVGNVNEFGLSEDRQEPPNQNGANRTSSKLLLPCSYPTPKAQGRHVNPAQQPIRSMRSASVRFSMNCIKKFFGQIGWRRPI